MDNWIDFALLASPPSLHEALRELSVGERAELAAELRTLLGLSEDELLLAILHLMIDRARPLSLPGRIWARPTDATWSVRTASAEHLEAFGLDVTEARLKSMQALYARFATERRQIFITEGMLRRHGYRCHICGIRFYNDELTDLGFASPFGTRSKAKSDELKPQWADPDLRKPTVDHVWPVSLYGSNGGQNIVVMCCGCNRGKAGYLSKHQTKPFVGLPYRKKLINGAPLHVDTFFAQLQRQPYCQETGRGPDEVELTAKPKDQRLALVLDNLVTVGSEDV